MNSTPAKRLFIGFATCFFIISTILTFGCSGSKLKVKYEKEDNSGYSKAEPKYKHKKAGRLHMPRLMDIGPNINTGIILPKRFTMILTGVFIFTLRVITGK